VLYQITRNYRRQFQYFSKVGSHLHVLYQTTFDLTFGIWADFGKCLLAVFRRKWLIIGSFAKITDYRALLRKITINYRALLRKMIWLPLENAYLQSSVCPARELAAPPFVPRPVMCIYVKIHKYILTHIYIYIYIYICVCVYHLYTHIYLYVWIHMYVRGKYM